MAWPRSVIIALLAASACGDDAHDDHPDGAVDAADAPPADAPPADAPPADAPPVDAPPVDAPPADAPLADAALDAPPVLDPLGFPTPAPAPLAADVAGTLQRAVAGATQVAWVDMDTTLVDVTAWYAVLDGQVAMQLDEFPDAVVTRPGAAGHAIVAVPASLSPGQVGGTDVAVGAGGPPRHVAVPDVVDVVDARADGTVLVEQAGAAWALRRLDAGFALDAGFGGAGQVPLPGPVGARAVQPIGAATVITLASAGRLVRVDATTGARVATFGAGGEVPLGLAPGAALLAIAPLPGGAVALVVRPAPGAGAIELVRVDASGADAAAQTIALPLPAVDAGADAAGRVVIAFAPVADTLRLIRLDGATGLVDPTFGVDGKAQVAAPAAAPPPGWTIADQPVRFVGVQADGRIALAHSYQHVPPGSCGALPVTCELPRTRLFRLD